MLYCRRARREAGKRGHLNQETRHVRVANERDGDASTNLDIAPDLLDRPPTQTAALLWPLLCMHVHDFRRLASGLFTSKCCSRVMVCGTG